MSKYQKPVTKSTILNIYEEIYEMPYINKILRSVRQRRLRDPENPEKLLPLHSQTGIDFTERKRMEKVIERIEEYVVEAKRKLVKGEL